MAGLYNRLGGPRRFVRGRPLVGRTRGPLRVPPMSNRPTVGPGSKASIRERLPGAIWRDNVGHGPMGFRITSRRGNTEVLGYYCRFYGILTPRIKVERIQFVPPHASGS